jgi:hypothetical protein
VRATIVTWQGGGATQPAIGLGRMLSERGHEVRIVAPGAPKPPLSSRFVPPGGTKREVGVLERAGDQRDGTAA